MTHDEVTQVMWAGFVHWAWKEPNIRKQFAVETGRVIATTSPTVIQLAIDAATGSDPLSSQAHAFVEWVTRTHWGIEYAPKAYREFLERKERS